MYLRISTCFTHSSAYYISTTSLFHILLSLFNFIQLDRVVKGLLRDASRRAVATIVSTVGYVQRMLVGSYVPSQRQGAVQTVLVLPTAGLGVIPHYDVWFVHR